MEAAGSLGNQLGVEPDIRGNQMWVEPDIRGNQLGVEPDIRGNQLVVEPGIQGNHKGVELGSPVGKQGFVGEEGDRDGAVVVLVLEERREHSQGPAV